MNAANTSPNNLNAWIESIAMAHGGGALGLMFCTQKQMNKNPAAVDCLRKDSFGDVALYGTGTRRKKRDGGSGTAGLAASTCPRERWVVYVCMVVTETGMMD